ncbi:MULTISPECIES: hypothetical protein [unclassified Isoptericola]|uniref:hypothetical protein n=1 Tax=unclassified Isoptericola TaxID=2623355 RepID=UPI003646AE53
MRNLRDPFDDATGGPFGQLGESDTANRDPPAQFQNVLLDDASVLETDHYTDLIGRAGR